MKWGSRRVRGVSVGRAGAVFFSFRNAERESSPWARRRGKGMDVKLREISEYQVAIIVLTRQ